MTSRRMGTLSALIATAVLFACMPGLLRSAVPTDFNRMDERLRPPRLRTLTVWMVGSETADRKLISQACASFEKERKGVRIFLRNADAQELLTPDAVLPDAVLFETGGVNMPEKVFVPLADEKDPSCMYAGVCYAVPLWLSPNVLSLPRSWLDRTAVQERRQASLLAVATPEPQSSACDVLSAQELPWEQLVQPGAVQLLPGVAMQQLLSMCPYPLRESLSRNAEMQAAQAQVRTLSQYLRAVETGEDSAACLLAPAVSDRVRYAALCRDSGDARAFLLHLQQTGAQSAPALGLIPTRGEAVSSHVLVRQAMDLFSGTRTLPNAFVHTKEEIRTLCSDAFRRCADPVETLLKLR